MPDKVLQRLNSAFDGIAIDKFFLINTGSTHHVILVNDKYVLRVARNRNAARYARVETALLDSLRDNLKVAIPKHRWISQCMCAYEKIEGQEAHSNRIEELPQCEAKTFFANLGLFLSDLHRHKPAPKIANQLPRHYNVPFWTKRRQLWRLNNYYGLPLQKQAEINSAFEVALPALDGDGAKICLVHADLWPCHIMLHEYGRVGGILDFGAACLSYPEVDLAHICQLYGPTSLGLLLAEYQGPEINLERVHALLILLRHEWLRHRLQGTVLVESPGSTFI